MPQDLHHDLYNSPVFDITNSGLSHYNDDGVPIQLRKASSFEKLVGSFQAIRKASRYPRVIS